jgi:signal transduction histidine kinase
MPDSPKNLSVTPKEIITRAFHGISTVEADQLLSVGTVHAYPEGTVLCQEDAVERKFYILLEGGVEVSKVINNIDRRVLKHLDAGDFFGEMALIHDAPRAATVTTTSPVNVMEIDKSNFEQVLQHSSSISMAMVREISSRLRANDEMAIGDLKMRASELAQAYQKLAEQELARREFLTNVAHELRTPLMAAGGFLQLMQKGLISGDNLNAALETVSRNIQQITSLVNDILFLQEMDLILPKFVAVDLITIAREVLDRYEERAAMQKTALHLNAPPDLPQVSGDPKSLERALTSLVDNAIKFSPRGGNVNVNMREDGNYIVIDIQDEGIGIAPDSLSRIFDRFYHSEKSGEELFSGIGLGLSITRQVIEQHTGTLSVESEPGKGSTFTVKLKAIKVMF